MSEPLVVGARRERVIFEEILRTQIVQYAGVSGDYSPLHTDETHAVSVGHPGIMAHGMMIMASMSLVLADWVGVEQLTGYGVRFRAPAWPGDRLTAAVTVEAVHGTQVDFRLSTTNQDGVEVVSGTATARLA